MDESTKNSPCKECGGEEDQLRAEVEHLRQHLAERDGHLEAIEAEFLKCSSRVTDLEEQAETWREKYERLYDAHRRVLKLNQVLEDRLLQMVDKMKGEKTQLTKDIATLSVRLAESKYNYSMLQKENERYKNDMNLAIQLLQCKPDNFVSQKLDNLSVDTQARVSQYVMSKTSKSNTSLSKNGTSNEDAFDASEYEFNISASLMSKILEDSVHDSVTKHCDTCTCSKTQNKPFCYNDTYFSVGTQTSLSGEMKDSLCLHCNADAKSVKSNLSQRSSSPQGIKLINDKNLGLTAPVYIVSQFTTSEKTGNPTPVKSKSEPLQLADNSIDTKVDFKKPEDLKEIRSSDNIMEPTVHHKLCDRTKTSLSSKRSSNSISEDVQMKDLTTPKEVVKSDIPKENHVVRKNSHSSMGAVSRTSSVAKSTVSTHKSGTLVGPGPRFCHLRMQAGSKNILLDNAEPDVPPVLYTRQSKCNENPIFKDLNDGMDNFIDLAKTDEVAKAEVKNDNVTVVESTLIDVHVDNNNRDSTTDVKTPINPVLMNVSSSPLQPLKTHTFSNSSENNNNKSQSITSQQNTSEVDNLLTDFSADLNIAQNNNPKTEESLKNDILTPTDNYNVKLFNFDRYEQTKQISTNPLPRSLKKLELAQLHTLENTRISKDFAPVAASKPGKTNFPNKSMPAIVNVYPNLTQTHLKVNEKKRVSTNEQSTSSLSSDDSAALLQKQQLLRVAEWVEQNLEQQNNYNDPLEDEVSFSSMIARRDSKLNRLTETLNELALNMPHPVSKFSKPYAREMREGHNNWIHSNVTAAKMNKKPNAVDVKGKVASVGNVTKETVFPVDSDVSVTETSGDTVGNNHYEPRNDFLAFQQNGDREITPEDLARMEYNVKKFLLSGPHWVSSDSMRRSRRTSSKTETDV